MVDLSQYATEKLMKMNERELKTALDKYKEQELPLWKFGIFVGYHAFFFIALQRYGRWLRGPQVSASFRNLHKYTIGNMLIKGTKHALIIGCSYLLGLYGVCYNRITLDHFRKLTQLQTSCGSFELRFSPNYQEYFLFIRMRKFDLSQDLIAEIKQELRQQRQKMIEEGSLLPKTIERLKEMDQFYGIHGNKG